MCWVTNVLRRGIGISEYTPGPIPKAKVRKPTRFGSRGNGHVVSHGLAVRPDPVVANLAREHRLIRAMIADASRIRGDG